MLSQKTSSETVLYFFFQTYIVYAVCKKGWGYQMRVGSLRNEVPGSGFLRRWDLETWQDPDG